MENEIQPNNQPVQPITQTSASSLNNWSIIILYILLGSIVVTGSVFIGIQIGKKQILNQQLITDKQIISPTPARINPTILPTETNFTNTTQGIKFTGIIRETNNGCWADGVCSIKVNDKWIIAEIGGLRPPNSKPEIRGNLIGISFSQDINKYIGKRVEVYAKQLENDKNYLTIYGDSIYYIKLLE